MTLFRARRFDKEVEYRDKEKERSQRKGKIPKKYMLPKITKKCVNLKDHEKYGEKPLNSLCD